MDALPHFFDDALLDDYEEAMEIADPGSTVAAPLPVPASSPVPDSSPIPVEAPTSVGVPPPAVAPTSDAASPKSTISEPLSGAIDTSGSNISKKISSHDPTLKRRCKVCNFKHPLQYCPVFKKMSHERKLRMVVLHKYCSRCLATSHVAKDCQSKFKCRTCKGDHNTLLHFNRPSQSGSNDNPASRSAQSAHNKRRKSAQQSSRPMQRSTTKKQATSHKSPSQSVLSEVCPLPIRHVVTFSPTMLLKLYLPKTTIPVRAALDPCCNVSYICESLVHQLRLPVSKVDDDKYCRLTVGSSYDPLQKLVLTAKVFKMKGVNTPSESVPDTIREHFSGFQLADPSFNRSGRVALVLGPEVYPQIIKNKIYSSPGLPMAQYTMFGWVISGQSPL